MNNGRYVNSLHKTVMGDDEDSAAKSQEVLTAPPTPETHFSLYSESHFP
jgi:hypothetical protein